MSASKAQVYKSRLWATMRDFTSMLTAGELTLLVSDAFSESRTYAGSRMKSRHGVHDKLSRVGIAKVKSQSWNRSRMQA